MTRYDRGVTTIHHKGKKVTTSVGTAFDEMVEKADDKVYKTSRLMSVHEGRSDLLSDVFYDTEKHWWFIQHINNISDPLQELTPGTIIKVPNR